MQHSIDRPGLPYGAILTHGYPRGVSLLVATLASFVAGITFGLVL